MNAEDFGSSRLIALGMIEHTLDEFLFELGDGFFEENAPVHHHSDQRFELLLQASTLPRRCPKLRECVARDALVGFPILIASRVDDIRRKSWAGRLLVPTDAFEIVA